MANRKLSEAETKICNRQIEKFTKELEYLGYIREHKDLLITKGIRLNYEKTLEDTKAEYAEILSQIKENQSKINTLQSQLKNGVEIKQSNDKYTG